MKSSLGNAYLFYLVITFVGIFCILFVGSAAYSKAFKIKDSIIDTIERYGGWDDTVRDEVNANLAAIGYQPRPNGTQCRDITVNAPGEASGNITDSPSNTGSNYDYCLYEIEYENQVHYKVVTFMRLDLPLLDRLSLSASGETITFQK